MNGVEFIDYISGLALEREPPAKVSNQAMWAFVVDAVHECKAMKEDIDKVKTKATLGGRLWLGHCYWLDASSARCKVGLV